MSLTTRAASALAVLSLAAIPVAALTLHGNSWDETPVAVNEPEAPGHVAAGGSVAAAAPQQLSHLVAQNITLDTDPASFLDHAPQTHALVPQNPASGVVARTDRVSEIETGSTASPAAERPRKRIIRRKKVSKNTTGAGSFQLLFQGPGK
ncbi:MAG: hypothetical protein J0H65_10320 [Rhizobiales bacterium]|nr:hypothetical protein [Hyphomicrobiales bacterium]